MVPAFPAGWLQVLAEKHVEHGGAGDAQLRREFAGTLVRLGDEYWERPGGVPFAADYYAAALMFDPADDQAIARMLVTPGELAALRQKAAEGTFTTEELTAAEPLAALADADPERRSKRIAKLANNERLPSTKGARLQKLARKPPTPPVKAPEASAPPPSEPAAEAVEPPL